MGKAIQGLNNVDDWQARITALGLVQGIAVGGVEEGHVATEYDVAFVSLLKGCHELVAAQIADLRSTVSKEVVSQSLCLAFFPYFCPPSILSSTILPIHACRTVAILARHLLLHSPLYPPSSTPSHIHPHTLTHPLHILVTPSRSIPHPSSLPPRHVALWRY